MATFIYFMGAEGGQDRGRLAIEVEHDHEDVAMRLSGAEGLVRFEGVKGRPMWVNPAAGAYLRGE